MNTSISASRLLKRTVGAASLLLLVAYAHNAVSQPLTDDKEGFKAPSTKFDLLGWSLSVPVDQDNNGKSDTIKEKTLNSGYLHPEYFYLTPDGGMVFKSPVKGAKTSKNTTYTRSELRGMMRRGDTSYETKGVNGNNWVFSSAPKRDQRDAAGVDGTMNATLAVNHVTTTGESYQVGRVVIGQIHANHDEPVRLYYRKLPGNSKGSVYYAHEPVVNEELWVEMIGSKSSNAQNPSDGIALDEKFSYRINVVGNALTVTITRPGKADVVSTTDMSDSGYDQGGKYMYFKAGVYNQNKSGRDDDYAQATFYKLNVNHDNFVPAKSKKKDIAETRKENTVEEIEEEEDDFFNDRFDDF